jgi:ankyrin repeat protein
MDFSVIQHNVFNTDNPKFLKYLIENGFIDIEHRYPMHGTILCAAASRYCVKTIEFLLNENADINSVDMDGKTPLHCAISAMHIPTFSRDNPSGTAKDTVELLMQRGADLSKQDNMGNTPLRMAARLDSPLTLMLLVQTVLVPDDADEMNYLIKNGFVGKDYITDWGTSVLCLAAALYSLGTALVLLNAGAEVNTADASGVTPLHYAIGGMKNSRYSRVNIEYTKAYYEAEAMVDILLYYGAGDDRDVQDDRGNTPLHVAALMNEPRIIRKLIERGAWWHLKTKNVDGYTAQELALDNKEKMGEWYRVPEERPSEYYQNADKITINLRERDRIRAMYHYREYEEPDVKVPIEITEYNTFQNMTLTVQLLEKLRLKYDKYFASIISLSYSLPDDMVQKIVQLPVTFRPVLESIRTPQKIFEGLFRIGVIRSINGVVRLILSSSIDEGQWGIDEHQARPRKYPTPSQAILWYNLE